MDDQRDLQPDQPWTVLSQVAAALSLLGLLGIASVLTWLPPPRSCPAWLLPNGASIAQIISFSNFPIAVFGGVTAVFWKKFALKEIARRDPYEQQSSLFGLRVTPPLLPVVHVMAVTSFGISAMSNIPSIVILSTCFDALHLMR